MKFRHEYKHRINNSDIILLRQRLSAIAKHDSFSRDDGKYYIASLYFDNYADKALREKLDGVNKREKFRIRYYNNDTSFIRLEKKSKINGLCLKESAVITAEECRRIINNDIDFLIESKVPLFNELYAKMRFQVLRPVRIVVYERECFVYAPGNVRVTIDTDIGGSGDINAFLSSEASITRLQNTAVLEVKWDEYLPQIIRDAVQMKNRSSSAFSKYAAVRF